LWMSFSFGPCWQRFRRVRFFVGGLYFPLSTIPNESRHTQEIYEKYDSLTQNPALNNTLVGAGNAIEEVIEGAVQLGLLGVGAIQGDEESLQTLNVMYDAVVEEGEAFADNPALYVETKAGDALESFREVKAEIEQLEAEGRYDEATQLKSELLTSGIFAFTGTGGLISGTGRVLVRAVDVDLPDVPSGVVRGDGQDSGSTGGSSIVSNDNSKADTSATADNDPVGGNNDSAEDVADASPDAGSLPESYTDLSHTGVGAALNTADLPDGHRRVADPDGNIVVLNARNQVVPDEIQFAQVDIENVVKGTPEYEVVNNPTPSTRVELDNGTTFQTNSGGFVEEISYQPVDSPGKRDKRQTVVGKEGIAGDVGGHIQACRHGGTCDRFNLFPQNSNFNGSAYKKWENKITQALVNGDEVGKVTIRFDRENPNNVRPDRLTVEYEINGVPYTRRFNNEFGG